MVNESPVMSFIFSFLSLVLFSTFIIQQLVQERESRNKQLQEVMGLRLWLDHLVWLLCSLLLLLIIVLLSTFLLSFGGLQPRADFGLLMLFLFCYGLSVVSFCYLVACLIPTTVLAVFTGVMMLLVFNIPFVSISVIQATVPLSALILTCLLPSTAFGFGFRIICQYELVEVGANYANLWIPPTKGSEMTLGLAISMLLLDTLIFFIITVITNHFRNDAPRQRSGEDGAEATNKRCSFMQHFSGKQTNDFTLNMFPECRVAKLSRAPDPKVTPGKDDVTSIKKEAVHVVDLDLGLKQSLQKGLSISGLRKIYHQSDSESRVAVDGLTLDLYEGQVLALLGHNGAGKTTIISMLTHEVKPTAGKIEVYGEDVSTREGWERARQMIGLCPQESVLFPLMTVEETLAYYTALKQRPSDPPPSDVSKVLANMDLLEHRHYMSHQLSEGLRRRLCMALAFVGNSKLVVLDEPTSGIDPAARSIMWEVISNNRSGRTILLTTHHLDEAETLADRVAVLHKNKMTLDPTLEPLAEEVTRLSLGLENRARNWSSCPDFVADTNPGIAECSVPGSSVRSSCQCVEERCVVEASGQPSLNDWILATRTEHVQSRHGGITLGVRDPREGEEGRSGALVWYDNAAYHALPAYINLLNNARLQRLAGPHHSITAINHPIVFTLHGMWSMSIQQHVADLGIGLLVLVALTVVCSATAGCVVAERVRGERRLLHLAGLSKKTYWIGSALWDTAVVVLNIVLISMVFLAFKEQQFIWRENLAAFVFLALLYGLSILPLFYLLEGWFRTEASAVFFFFCSFFGVGLITTLLLVVCQVMSYIKGMNDTAAVIKYVFLVFPPFAFTCSLKDMAASYTRASIMARFDMDLYQSPFTWDSDLQGGLGVYMVALSVWALVGWVLLLVPRPRLVPGQLPVAETAEEDQDVAAERIKIQCGGTSLYDTVLRLVGLGRDFSSPRITAVGNLFLAVRRGECFSLLGLNGAGKTTTFRCLTGDLQPSRGQILVNGLLLEEALELPTPILSYCPQGNALDPNLTPREVFRVLTSHQSDGLIPLPVNIAQSRGSIPSLLPHHQLARIKPLAKDNTFQHPSILAPVECINPTAPYGNFEYPLKGYERGGSLPPESRSASDSPEEEWTKL
ncbi:ATP-binding cassette sub-family A member 1 [Portunus trituberculatus]|uniref:ATP-binding cassette sub-family A member 1 n=1 Tax=Portunus trituberculatus TaxID=210409 RepID=A0A5B7CYI1_PORTR|nr:ATP-binding cassette sub-family A member 1 [Portunus trituberculatus]